MRTLTLLLLSLLTPNVLPGQGYPEGAHVNLYFPQLADGGTPTQSWQTWFIFNNPDETRTANVILETHANDGSPLVLDLGQGLRSTLNFSVPPKGRVTLRSKVASQTIVTGWAAAYSDIPLQATVFFRLLTGNTPQADYAAPATLPSFLYRSAGNRNLGIALANGYNSSISATVTAISQDGAQLGSAPVTLPPLGHSSFNLNLLFPNLPGDFLGSVEIRTTNPPNVILAWTLNEDGGLLSTLPPGRLEWPISHSDRIWLVWRRAIAAAKLVYPEINWDSPPLRLDMPSRWYAPNGTEQVNASSRSDGTVKIPYSMSELISDSESELGFIVCHEIGHQLQYRTPGIVAPHRLYDPNVETDADEIGLTLVLWANFDPYAAAGALAKLAMINGAAGLSAQVESDIDVILGLDPHPSYGTRIDALWNLLKDACASPDLSATCSAYKRLIHPSFPPNAPLRAPNQPSRLSSDAEGR